jgi:hypothetical protein
MLKSLKRSRDGFALMKFATLLISGISFFVPRILRRVSARLLSAL